MKNYQLERSFHLFFKIVMYYILIAIAKNMFTNKIKHTFIISLLFSTLNPNLSDRGFKKNLYLYWQKDYKNQIISTQIKETGAKETEEANQARKINVLLKEAQNYLQKGQFYSAITQLNKILALNPSEKQVKALTHKKLGNAYSGVGKFQKAVLNYQISLKQEMEISTLNNLVKTLLISERYNNRIAKEAQQTNSSAPPAEEFTIRAKQNREQAVRYAERAILISQNNINKFSLSSVIALINWHNAIASGNSEPVTQNLSSQQLYRGGEILKNLPDSRNLAFTILNWSKIDRDKYRLSWLNKALKIAEDSNDVYLKSYVLLELGKFYQKQENFKLALHYAQKSQVNAQSVFAYDSLFRSQQLIGQIYQPEDKPQALLAYKNAINSLELLNQNSSSIGVEQRINFESKIEPIYRQALKLTLNHPNLKKSDLIEAIAISDKLRVAQLQNYFGDDCFEIRQNKTTSFNQIQSDTALINSIILEDRVFLILQLPDGSLNYSQTKIDKAQVYSKAEQWNKELNDRANWDFIDNSRFFNDLIVKPFESHLQTKQISQIVFVHDGILRNLPMAALFDGENFLAQKWASTSSLGLNSAYSISSQGSKPKAIAFGLQEAIFGWTALENVASEIAIVQNIIGGDKFLNTQFTSNNLKHKLSEESYSTVHLATHASFGGTAETSFILAHDGKIPALELEDILTQSKQIPTLLVLSACQTATGNDSSLLGLAGIAARSGVESTMGSLWQVNDREQGKMIEAFYRHWQNPQYNKATALQKVQIEEIEGYINSHPQKWAALSLIDNHN